MVNYASSEKEYNEMCEAEAAHDAEMEDQDAQAQVDIQDEYEHDMRESRNARTTDTRMAALRQATKQRAAMVADIDDDISFLQDSIKRDCIESGKTIKTDAGTVTFRKVSKITSWGQQDACSTYVYVSRNQRV